MPETLAGRARAAVDDRPFLRDALRAGVVNYAAAARTLDVDGDEDAVATALRRYADELPALEADAVRASVSMRSGVGPVDDPSDALLTVGDTAFGDGGDDTALVASGDVDAAALASVLGRLAGSNVTPVAAGVADDALVVVVDRRDGATAVRAVEAALTHVVR